MGLKWCVEGATGRSSGLLTFWDDQRFACSSCWGIGGTVVVVGQCRDSGEEFCIINVYTSCDLREKRLLWDRISLVVGQWEEAYTCVIGDFNSILNIGKRSGVGGSELARDIRVFREFVESYGLLDVPLQGRKYTWYSCAGMCKSKLDRALVNDRWAAKWQGTELGGIPRSISDHCPIILSTKRKDWGPEPFRFINAWMTEEGFKDLVEESWNR